MVLCCKSEVTADKVQSTKSEEQNDGNRLRFQLQSQASASAEPADPQYRHPDDRRVGAVVLLRLEMGAGAVYCRLDISVRRPRDRGKSARLLQKSYLSAYRPALLARRAAAAVGLAKKPAIK